MPSFSAIVTTHAFEKGLRNILGNLIYQTRRPDETIVLYSGYEPGIVLRLREDFPQVTDWIERPDLQDWGHDKRARGVELATKDFLGFFNDDDVYDRQYLEKMLALAEDSDAVYCDWNISNVGFHLGASTSGNFIVRTQIAKEIGYPWRDYCADGHFINAIAARTTPAKVREALYTWNALER